MNLGTKGLKSTLNDSDVRSGDDQQGLREPYRHQHIDGTKAGPRVFVGQGGLLPPAMSPEGPISCHQMNQFLVTRGTNFLLN